MVNFIIRIVNSLSKVTPRHPYSFFTNLFIDSLPEFATTHVVPDAERTLRAPRRFLILTELLTPRTTTDHSPDCSTSINLGRHTARQITNFGTSAFKEKFPLAVCFPQPRYLSIKRRDHFSKLKLLFKINFIIAHSRDRVY